MSSIDAHVQALVGAQFQSLADTLAAQPPSVADAQTLCDGWAVRHIVAHVTMAARYDGPAFAAELASVAYDFDALSNTIAVRDGNLDFDRLLGDLRSDTMAAWVTPGGGATGSLSHIVIHGLDITVALDLPRSADDQATRVVLDSLTGSRAATPFGVGLAGWCLTATDIDWQHGDGVPVTATSDELVLALAGRPRPGIELRKDLGTPTPTG